MLQIVSDVCEWLSDECVYKVNWWQHDWVIKWEWASDQLWHFTLLPSQSDHSLIITIWTWDFTHAHTHHSHTPVHCTHQYTNVHTPVHQCTHTSTPMYTNQYSTKQVSVYQCTHSNIPMYLHHYTNVPIPVYHCTTPLCSPQSDDTKPFSRSRWQCVAVVPVLLCKSHYHHIPMRRNKDFISVPSQSTHTQTI